jgi:hypothetical protein
MNIEKHKNIINIKDLLTKPIIIQKYYIKQRTQVQKDNKFYSKILQ